jgi:polyisoprenoid-binding protein YceI
LCILECSSFIELQTPGSIRTAAHPARFVSYLLDWHTLISGMVKMRLFRPVVLASAIAFLLILSAAAQTSTWTIDPNHSTAEFTVRHLGISNVSGNFTKVSGTVTLSDKDITHSQVTATIEVNSVDTRVPDRDKDLRSPNFFDAEKYPTIEFKSKRIVNNAGKLQLVGDLTLHGTTREVTLDLDGPTPELSDPWGNLRRGFSAITTINRKDFGVVWNNTLKTGEAIVGDTVKIQIDVELVKKKA